MDLFKILYEADKKRNETKIVKRLLYLMRKYQATDNKYLKFIYYKLAQPILSYYSLDIPLTLKVGGGLYIGHHHSILINSKAVIGWNVNIHHGVVIGQENRGKRKGAPVIGNNVWIGVKSVIVGNITIGDDVLIAPNSFVNCNVPSHSIVLGNPCIIKHRDNATADYITNPVEIVNNIT